MPTLPEGPALDLLREAVRVEAGGQRALLAGDAAVAFERLAAASDLYRRSWELAAPDAYGRLIGMLKAAVLAGDAGEAAAYALAELGDGPPPSPPAAYARAIAALVQGDDATATAAAGVMRAGSEAFGRAAAAIAALCERDGAAFRDAVAAIVADFEGRSEHLTGVPIADTALMLERLAEGRGLASGVRSPLLP